MGKADFYKDGEWNFTCDLCGAKNKSGDAMKTWQNLYVCKHHREVRNPQDFLRGVRDNQSTPWSRPKPPETFVPEPEGCTLRGSNSIPGYAVPGCAIPGYVNLAFLASQPVRTDSDHCTLEALNSIPGFAGAGCSIPSYDNISELENSALDTVFGKY